MKLHLSNATMIRKVTGIARQAGNATNVFNFGKTGKTTSVIEEKVELKASDEGYTLNGDFIGGQGITLRLEVTKADGSKTYLKMSDLVVNIRVDTKDMYIDAGSAHVKLTTQSSRVVVTTTSGDVDVIAPDATSVQCSSINGDAVVTAKRVDSVTCSNGDIFIEGAVSHASSVNGNVRVR